MRHLSLFSGIGGADLAAHWAGMRTFAFCERESFCQSVLRKHWPDVPIIDDVHHVTREELDRLGVGAIDIISGGFPCQPFSHAGKRGGTADDRYLWPEMLRVIADIRPAWVIGENVEGLVSMAQSDWEFVMEDEDTLCEEAEMVLESIRQDLEAIGYSSVILTVPAAAVGASHRRYRIFLVGYAECGGRTGYERRRADQEPSDGRSDVADAEGKRRGPRRAEPAGQPGELRASGCGASCEALADADKQHDDNGGYNSSTICGERESTELPRREALADSTKQGGGRLPVQQGRPQQADGYAIWSRQNVADTSGAGRQERDASAEPKGPGYDSGRGDAQRADGSAQSGMGGSLDELSAWVDGGINPLDAIADFIATYPQPALMGRPQYDWEPPRVTTGIANRGSRLKGLGNSIDPLQIYPIFYAIKWLHER